MIIVSASVRCSSAINRCKFCKNIAHTTSFVDQVLVLGGVRLQIEQAPQDFSKGKKKA